jgi:hypothetical protein
MQGLKQIVDSDCGRHLTGKSRRPIRMFARWPPVAEAPASWRENGPSLRDGGLAIDVAIDEGCGRYG